MKPKPNLLIIDDEQHLIDLVKNIFKDDHKIFSAQNGKEALKIIEKIKPNLIILDIMMPDMSGIDVLKKIRKNPETKKIKVIVLSVIRPSEIGKDKIKKLQVIKYVQKPFEIEVLKKAVKNVLDKGKGDKKS